MDHAGILNRLVLVGSWCLRFYQEYFNEPFLYSMLRTRDMDFLVPTPSGISSHVDVVALLGDLGFVRSVKADGTIQLMHPEVMLEFLVADRGRGRKSPWPLPELGINAQPLRFMDIAEDAAIRIEVDGINVRVPHPAAFALHKLLVVPRRTDSAKAERDVHAAVSLLTLLVKNGDTLVLQDLLDRFPCTWVKTIRKVLAEKGHEDLLDTQEG